MTQKFTTQKTRRRVISCALLFFFLLNVAQEAAAVPVAPVATAASGVSNNIFYANFNLVSGATGYRIDVAKDAAFTTIVSPYSNYDVTGITGYTAGKAPIYFGITASTTYYYRLRATDASGSSLSSNVISVVTTAGAIPDPPVASAATSVNVTASSFTANWATAAHATGYKFDMAYDPAFAHIIAGYNDLTVASTSLAVTGVPTNATVWYRVRGTNTYGTSANSSSIKVNVSPIVVLAPVQNDHLLYCGDMSLNYTAVSGTWSSNFKIEYWSPDQFGTLIASPTFSTATAPPNAGSHPVASTVPSGDYQIKIYGTTTTSYWGWSDQFHVNANQNLSPVLSTSSIGTTSFTLTWPLIAGATSYAYEVYPTSGFVTPFLTGTATPGDASGLPITVNTSTHTWYVRMNAINACATSPWSSLPVPLLVGTPTLTFLGADENGCDSFSSGVSWGAITDAAGYDIFVNDNLFETCTCLIWGESDFGYEADIKVKVRAFDAGGVPGHFSGVINLLQAFPSGCLGARQADSKSAISVYPNPASDYLTVDFSNGTIATTKTSSLAAKSSAPVDLPGNSIKIFNSASQQVLAAECATQKMSIDVRSLPKGIYYVKMFTGSNEKTYRVIIER